jgi:hypothetical protein
MSRLRTYVQKYQKAGSCSWRETQIHFLAVSWKEAKKLFTEHWLSCLGDESNDRAQLQYDELYADYMSGKYIDTIVDDVTTYTIRGVR